MPAKKVAAKKTSAKKPAKKVAVKKVKSAKPKTKAPKKTSAKKADKDIVHQPVTFAGPAKVRLIDDPGEATEGESIQVKPSVDPDTGVLVMVPVTY